MFDLAENRFFKWTVLVFLLGQPVALDFMTSQYGTIAHDFGEIVEMVELDAKIKEMKSAKESMLVGQDHLMKQLGFNQIKDIDDQMLSDKAKFEKLRSHKYKNSPLLYLSIAWMFISSLLAAILVIAQFSREALLKKKPLLNNSLSEPLK